VQLKMRVRIPLPTPNMTKAWSTNRAFCKRDRQRRLQANDKAAKTVRVVVNSNDTD
jgi:hypothetical protein